MDIRYVCERDDWYGISRVYEESWKHAYKGIIPDEYLDSLQKGRQTGILNNTDFYHVIMLDGDKIIGTSCFCASRYEELKDYGEVVSVYLLPEYVGKGCGKHLLKFVVNGLQGQGYNDIFLWVLEANERARIFYESQGFSEDGKSRLINIGGKELRELMYIHHI